MKKLSLIVAMAVILTIGGVFATWTYNDGAVQSVNPTIGVAIEAAEQTGAAATLTADVSGVSLNVTNEGNFGTKFDTANTGTVVITLAPNSLASDNIKQNGMALKITITENFADVLSTDIITISNPVINVATTDLQESGSNFTYTFNLLTHLTMANINIDTYAKYEDLKESLDDGKITITVETVGETA